MRAPLLTIAFMLSLGFVTRYGGTDATLGLAFTRTGVLYPFFAAMLGWLGVALTGSDTSSNVLFGSLQKITAEQLGLNPILITTANTTGGVMGKMIDAQSIVVATAATNQHGQEGRILRFVFWHSIALARDHGHHRDAAGLRLPVDGAVAMNDPSFLAELRRIAGDDGVFSEPLEVLTYECDALTHLRQSPVAVVLPRRPTQVQEIVRLCATRGVRSCRAGMAPASRAGRCRSKAASSSRCRASTGCSTSTSRIAGSRSSPASPTSRSPGRSRRSATTTRPILPASRCARSAATSPRTPAARIA